MIELASETLQATVDPSHGGEILHLRVRRTGTDLLGHPPFVPRTPVAGDLDEATWTGCYRGGWQLAAPNAGAACRLGGIAHGFHGRASVDPWAVASRGADHLTLEWTGHGVRLRRDVRIAAMTLHVALSWEAVADRAPLIVVEHICFGRELLDPEVTLSVDAAASASSESVGPVQPVGGGPRWPAYRRADGTIERRGPLVLAERRAEFGVMTDLVAGAAEIVNPSRALGVRLVWDAGVLPSAWLWEEFRASEGIWGRQAELLGFEPAAVPHALGLAHAVRSGQALWAEPGVAAGYGLSLTVVGAESSASG